MIELLIFVPHDDFVHHAPTGFVLADEFFEASRLKDPISAAQQQTVNLKRDVYYLLKRYPNRVSVQWVDPWSVLGLWVAFRHRMRTFPSVLVDRKILLVGDEIRVLKERVEELLSQSPASSG